MPANSRWDLIQGLKGEVRKRVAPQIFHSVCAYLQHTHTHTTKVTCYYKHTKEGEGRTFQQTREEENFGPRFEKNILCLICQRTDRQR